MVNARRRDIPHLSSAYLGNVEPVRDTSSYARGAVGQMQADLARRLAEDWVPQALSHREHMMRMLSVTGGYVALLAGFASAAWLMWH